MEYIYKNNTLYEWEVNQNGFFCIVRSNLPPQYTVQQKTVIMNLFYLPALQFTIRLFYRKLKIWKMQSYKLQINIYGLNMKPKKYKTILIFLKSL